MSCSLFFRLCQICARIDGLHELRNAVLTRTGPLGVMFPDDVRTDTENVCDVLLGSALHENLSGKRMPPMPHAA